MDYRNTHFEMYLRKFMQYLREEFPDPMENHFTFTLVENLVIFAYENFGHSKDRAKNLIADILPEVDFEEISIFLPEFL